MKISSESFHTNMLIALLQGDKSSSNPPKSEVGIFVEHALISSKGTELSQPEIRESFHKIHFLLDLFETSAKLPLSDEYMGRQGSKRQKSADISQYRS